MFSKRPHELSTYRARVEARPWNFLIAVEKISDFVVADRNLFEVEAKALHTINLASNVFVGTALLGGIHVSDS